ncbi:patatin-like phospholipase family protein [Streptomyces fagopyri]|nr:patatin-like phospholipase family protein [Streptomyces fagopyri]
MFVLTYALLMLQDETAKKNDCSRKEGGDMDTLHTDRSAIAPSQAARVDRTPHSPVPAESIPRDTVAFVLQGGGSLCASQVGALRALTQAGITPDLVVGSSAGALNSVAFAADPSIQGTDRMEALWLGIKRRHVAPIFVPTLVKALVGREEAAVSNAGLRQFLRHRMGVKRLESGVIPVHVVATDIKTGAAVVLSQGDAVSALLASAAFPGLYPPVRIGKHRLIDGGVSADTPVRQAEALGASTIYVLPAAITQPTDRHTHAVLLAACRAVGHILDERERRDVATVRGTVVRLPSPVTPVGSLIDFRDTRRLIQVGHSLTWNWLAQHAAAMA